MRAAKQHFPAPQRDCHRLAINITPAACLLRQRAGRCGPRASTTHPYAYRYSPCVINVDAGVLNTRAPTFNIGASAMTARVGVKTFGASVLITQARDLIASSRVINAAVCALIKPASTYSFTANALTAQGADQTISDDTKSAITKNSIVAAHVTAVFQRFTKAEMTMRIG